MNTKEWQNKLENNRHEIPLVAVQILFDMADSPQTVNVQSGESAHKCEAFSRSYAEFQTFKQKVMDFSEDQLLNGFAQQEQSTYFLCNEK